MVDQIVPIAEGGEPYEVTNLRAACGPCNSRLGGRLGNLRRAFNAGQMSFINFVSTHPFLGALSLFLTLSRT